MAEEEAMREDIKLVDSMIFVEKEEREPHHKKNSKIVLEESVILRSS